MEKDIKLKKEWFIEQGTGKIEDNYEIDERMVHPTIFSLKYDQELGSGTYGRVIKAKNKYTKASRAIKIIPKAKVKNHEKFKNEIDILKELVSVFYPNPIGPSKHYQAIRDLRGFQERLLSF